MSQSNGLAARGGLGFPTGVFPITKRYYRIVDLRGFASMGVLVYCTCWPVFRRAFVGRWGMFLRVRLLTPLFVFEWEYAGPDEVLALRMTVLVDGRTSGSSQKIVLFF